MYKQLGKAYFLEPKSKLLADGEAAVKAAEVEHETCKNKRATIEAKVQEAKKELMEAMK
jgi:chaperonin cofactor prefoldin